MSAFCDKCRPEEPGVHEPGCENHPAYDYFPADAGIPRLYAQDGKGMDATVYVKLFVPVGAATWYITEYDPEERIAFGWCALGIGGDELGYVSADELESIRLMGGHVRVERDLYWTPKTIREALAGPGSVQGD